jgi:hypothetical protein
MFPARATACAAYPPNRHLQPNPEVEQIAIPDASMVDIMDVLA